MVRGLLLLLCWFGTGAPLLSHEGHDHELTTDKEKLIEALLSERTSEEALDQLISEARENHISEQILLEARFLFYIDQEDDQKISTLLPDFEARRNQFSLAESAIFASTDDWLAIIEYVKAMDALIKEDQLAFKKHITEAFWYSPNQGAAFAPHVERIRKAQWIKNATLDLEVTFPNLLSKKNTKLKEVLSDQKALLLHFWSPKSEECQNNMADFLRTSKRLQAQGIAMISVLPENSPQRILEAKDMLKTAEEKPEGSWIIDSKNNFLSQALNVKSLPLVVVVSTDGTVLFHGHPSEKEFWDTLSTINPIIHPPKKIEDE